MKKWMVMAKKADFNEIAAKYNISPMLARILRNRDVISDDDIDMFLNGRPEDMYNPHLMKDMDKAVNILSDAINNGSKIFVIGDYDIDGVCSSLILKKGLELCGATACVRIPDRVLDGYGMNMSMIDEAIEGGYDCIITCDNGIAAAKEVEYAKSKDLKIIVTDHHEVPYETDELGNKQYIVPKADAVVDPKQEECSYPFKGLCGGAVAYKLISCMADIYPCLNQYMDEFLMFAAFATVGDVMELLSENHIIVKYGIEVMKRTDNIGMNALIDATAIERNNLSPYHIGFILGPCINATGRLATADDALSLFLCDKESEAALIANKLKLLNDERKSLTETYLNEAFNQIEKSSELKKSNVLVVYLPECHESLAGIIAGKIRERYYKPAFVLTKASDGGVKGSGRSIEDYHMYEELNKCKELLTKFGGHKLAAGLSLEEENIRNLLTKLNDNENLTEDNLIEKIRIDVPMPISYATLNFADEIGKLAPFGNGNSSPLFAQKDVKIVRKQLLGKNENVVKLELKSVDANGNEYIRSGIMFGDGRNIMNALNDKESIDIVYSVKVNEFRGNRDVQLEIKEFI